jgi:hypothetical protein
LRDECDAVVYLQVAEESDPVVDRVFYYQAPPADAAFYDVLVVACDHMHYLTTGVINRDPFNMAQMQG